jgi:hypothetical protein
MKNIVIILTVLLFIGTNTFAQESVDKDVFLTTINSVNSLKLSNLRTTQLMDYNKGFADKVYAIVDSDKSDKDQEKDLKELSNSTASDLHDLLGADVYKKYAKLMREQLKPLIKKSENFKYLYQD